ncbi:MAG: phage portal protein [Phycisphaeraceae bacterium]|nr:phage portal protein [Phycisphaeraceae bacterium]
MKAEQAASFPIRMYARSDKRKGRKMQGKRLVDLKRVENVGSKSAQYAESAGSNVVEITSDPALNILHKPNPFMNSGHELFVWLFLMQEACGNAFTEVAETGNPNSPIELLPLFPQYMGLIPNKGEDIPSLVLGYVYGAGSTRVQYDYSEVIHFKRAPSMYSSLWGSSPLQAVAAEADLLEMATLNELANWQNGCSLNLVYKVSPDATEAQVKQIRSQLEARHQGVAQANRVFVGSGELTSLDLKAKEMQYREGQRYYSQMILAAYRVPESKVRLNDANLGSARTADIEFLSESIRPMLVRMAETLTEELLYKRLGYERGSVWFAYDDIVPRDIATINAAAVGLVQNRIWTPDEARAELGYGPLPNGEGEKLVTPLGGFATPAAPVIDGEKVPQSPQGPKLTDPATATAVAAPPADLALNGAQIDSLLSIAQLVAAGQLPAPAAKEILYAAFPTVPSERIAAIIGGLEGFKPAAPESQAPSAKGSAPGSNAPAEPAEAAKPAEQEPEPEGKAVTVASWQTAKGPDGKALTNQKRAASGLFVMGGRVLQAFDIDGKDVTGDAIADLSRKVEQWYKSEGGTPEHKEKELASILRPHIEAIFQRGGIDGLSTLAGMPGGSELIAAANVSFDILPDNALRFLETYTIRLAKQITETQQSDLQLAISYAIENGMTSDEARRAVQEALPEIASWKADQIARTESARAYTSGNLEAWKEVGVERKEWLLAPGSCIVCQAVAAKYNGPLDINTPFLKVGDSLTDDTGQMHTFNYQDIDAAPLHPGCRCDIVPVI